MTNLHPTKAVIGLVTVPATAGAAWLCAAVGKYGVHLNKPGVTALAIAGAAAAVSVGLKLIHDVEATHPAVAQAIHDVAELDPTLAAELGLADTVVIAPAQGPAAPAPSPTTPAPAPAPDASGWPPSA